ncbi:unnamed protein product [Bursaphelenchus okinawaensis]|uniref:Latrophilin Cirl n=1 Tax=Bursaphelenchus okinawaensis TaxID=465554 RepID=A0A811K0U0_9BILA|nr:unnamed protein product [Bursaphelenchus okinawaensis]CAG9088471.1 unnamed protein product [Bursaphelenchus okinawaensis]
MLFICCGRLKSTMFWLLFGLMLLKVNANEEQILQVCEGELAHLECQNENTVITVKIANFGRYSLLPCNPHVISDLNTNCGNNGTKLIVEGLCDGKTSCNFTVSGDLFGDACRGTPKYLEAQYICVPVTTTAAPTTTLEPTEMVQQHDIEQGIRNEDKVDYKISNPREAIETLPEVRNSNCAAEYYRLVQWPQTKPAQLAKAACPVGSQGTAKRRCSDGKWHSSADLSECISDSIRQFHEDHEHFFSAQSVLPVFIGHELKTLVSGALMAGDLIKVSLVLERIQIHNGRNEIGANREDLSEFAKTTLQTVNDLLQVGQRDSWLDLPHDLQRSTAFRLLRTTQRSLRNIAKSVPFSEAIRAPFVARPYVVGAVAVVRQHTAVELPYVERDGVDDRALFSLADEVKKMEDDFELAYSSVSALAPFIVQKHHHVMERNPEREDCQRTVISNVISTFAARRAQNEQKDVTLTEIPMVLSFSTKKSTKSPFPYCARFDSDAEDFVYDPNCEILVHNDTKTICRCKGVGHFAVIASSCEVKTVLFGLTIETIALYSSIIFAIIGLTVYMIGLSLNETKKPTMIPKNFSKNLILAEILLAIWFGLPRSSTLSVIVFYGVEFGGLCALCWFLVQLFVLIHTVMKMFENDVYENKNKGMYYLVGCGVPLLITAVSVVSCGNFDQALQGRQRLWTAPMWNLLAPLMFIIMLQSVLIVIVVSLLCKHRRVGYEPCRNDFGKDKAARKCLYHTVPFLVLADFVIGAMFMLTTRWTVNWLWVTVAANLLLMAWSLKSFFFKGQNSTCLCRKSKGYGASDLPKDSIFSPVVQARGSVPNVLCCDPSYSTKSTAIVQYLEDGPKTMAIPDFHALHCQNYVATQGGIHDAHYCDHTYATIPAEYCSYYTHNYQQQSPQYQQQSGQYQQHTQYHHAQMPAYPPPPAPDYNQHVQSYGPYFQHQQRLVCMHEYSPPSPICNEHGHRCPSLVGIRAPSQLQHKPSSASTSNVSSGSPYESARSSSTATGSQLSTSTQGTTTALLRMDMSRNMPVFFDDSSS